MNHPNCNSSLAGNGIASILGICRYNGKIVHISVSKVLQIDLTVWCNSEGWTLEVDSYSPVYWSLLYIRASQVYSDSIQVFLRSSTAELVIERGCGNCTCIKVYFTPLEKKFRIFRGIQVPSSSHAVFYVCCRFSFSDSIAATLIRDYRRKN